MYIVSPSKASRYIESVLALQWNFDAMCALAQCGKGSFLDKVATFFCRAELSSEDDLSPDSDSDAMDVDSTAQEPPPSSAGAAGAGSSGSRGDKRQGGQQLGGAPSASSSANGKTGTVAGALVPDTAPQFAVSQHGIVILLHVHVSSKALPNMDAGGFNTFTYVCVDSDRTVLEHHRPFLYMYMYMTL